ncbi:hypothetical protein H4R34_001139 [Dimargaris verticillata]|uniref:Uncharacterized protein n=1 Tax=Dimargaris verticillata TaxID=2761393 RepID=A0A9W8B5B9_9FUNG|nr:hypothetical protein H4R34_001139 [Dimargaris verticillata]
MSAFWQTVKKYLVVNPKAVDSMLNPGTYRKPSPNSQKKYIPKVTEAFDVANNYYFQRDVRRNYPRLAVYTQSDVANFLLGPPAAKEANALPSGEQAQTSVAESADQSLSATSMSLPQVIESLKAPLYTATNLPPVPGKTVKFEATSELPCDIPGEYFPIYTAR